MDLSKLKGYKKFYHGFFLFQVLLKFWKIRFRWKFIKIIITIFNIKVKSKMVSLNKNKMITAKEAKILSMEGAKLTLIPLVERIIKDAANSGKDSVFINSDNITENVREILASNGYFVGGNNNNKIEIIWRR